MTVYDLGANVGFYTLLFSRLVGPGALVHAFEPVGRNVWYLRRHLELNPTLNARVHEIAVGHETGMVAFDFSACWSMGRVVARFEADTSRLPAVSLDDFVYGQGREPPDLIKMDIEGGEVDAIAGMSRLLAEQFPVLLVSVHGSSRWRECLAVLETAGYTVLDLDGMPARPEAARDDLLALPPEFARGAPARIRERPSLDFRRWDLQQMKTGRRSEDAAVSVNVIEPPSGWRMVDLRELWAYRELLWALTVRDLKVRYKQTVLGVAWAIIQPVTAMIIFSVIFGRLAGLPSDGHPYPVFVFAGLLPWTFFANAISAIGGSVVGSGALLSKIYFPRLIIPLTPIGSGMVDFAISTGVLLLLLLYYGVPWGSGLAAVPLLVVGVVATAVGAGTLLAALTAAYRDFRYVIPFLTQMWLFATPVVYPGSLVPEAWRWALYLNPMAGWIDGFRAAFFGRSFDPLGLAISSVVATILLLGGLTHFARVERKFADII